MFLIIIYSLLLTLGFVSSQLNMITGILSEESIHIIASICLSYIMIHVGLEFEMPKEKNIEDHVAAMSGAVIPWILCSLYIILAMSVDMSPTTIKKAFLLGCFAAPTSAGILFSMLEGAGLSHTWVFQKAKMLAVLDDIYTLLLIIPLRALNFGISFELLINSVFVIFLFYIGYNFPHSINIKSNNTNKIGLAFLVTGIMLLIKKLGCEIDIVTPSFVTGWLINSCSIDDHSENVKGVISAIFMFMVGCSMPNIKQFFTNQEGELFMIGIHVLAITQLSNFGKFTSCLFFRKEASIKERIALSVSMLPRGEVGAGILMIAASAGIKGIAGVVAILSLALNLISTGFLIKIVKTILG